VGYVTLIGRKERGIQGFGVGKRSYLEDLGVEGRIIVK
jgi:hypothetical protein